MQQCIVFQSISPSARAKDPGGWGWGVRDSTNTGQKSKHALQQTTNRLWKVYASTTKCQYPFQGQNKANY